jgi:replicative DNA helicase
MKQKTPITTNTELGKVPPQAVDAEEMLLGLMLRAPGLVDETKKIFAPEYFYKTSHTLIAEAILSLSAKNIKPDIVSVTQELKAAGKLEDAGGAYYLTQLTNTPENGNAMYYCQLIFEMYMRRLLIAKTHATLSDCYDLSKEVFSLADETHAGLNEISEKITGLQPKKTVSEVRGELIQRYKRAYETGETTKKDTGLKPLTKATGGFDNGDLIVIAGRPSMGKTAVALHMARNCSEDMQIRFHSLEMTSDKLTERLMTSLTGWNLINFQKGKVTHDDLVLLEEKTRKLDRLNISIDDYPVQDVEYIKSAARLQAKDKGLDMLFVDYLQIVNSPQSSENEVKRLSKITKALKQLARELNIPVVLLSQLSRAVETRAGGRRPMLSDLRDSGAIEEDADMVIFPFRPYYYEKETSPSIFFMYVAKFRNGQVCDVELLCSETMTDFYESYEEEPF